MSEEYGNDFVVLTDEDGNEEEFEHLDTLEYNGETYMAFIPAEMSALDEAELVILKLINEGEDEMLESIEDERELETVYGMFLDRLESEDFYGDEEEDEEDEE